MLTEYRACWPLRWVPSETIISFCSNTYNCWWTFQACVLIFAFQIYLKIFWNKFCMVQVNETGRTWTEHRKSKNEVTQIQYHENLVQQSSAVATESKKNEKNQIFAIFLCPSRRKYEPWYQVVEAYYETGTHQADLHSLYHQFRNSNVLGYFSLCRHSASL